MKTKFIIPVTLLYFSDVADCAVSIFWRSNPAVLLADDGTPLSNGLSGVPGDGFLVEAGYYSNSTLASPFAGNWIQLAQCSIGDFVTFAPDVPPAYRPEMGAGMFSLTLTTNSPIPSGVLLTFRFYDSTSPSINSRYNAVSSSSWEWVGEPSLKASLDESPGLVWLGGPDSAFRTTIAVPEPSTPIVIATGMMFVLGRRTRPRSFHCSPLELKVYPSTEQQR